MTQAAVDRTTLRALVPEKYLARGWRDPASGAPFAQLTGVWATAAAEQLLAGRVAVQELETTYEAFYQVLLYYREIDPFVATEAATEAVDLAAGLLAQPSNPALVAWLEPCVLALRDWEDAKVFILHMRAVVLQYPTLARSAQFEP